MPYLLHFACFGCHRAFKRRLVNNEFVKKCPHCCGVSVRLGRHFKAPKINDRDQWMKVRYLAEHGFIFQHIHETRRGGLLIRYPDTLKEAETFVKQYHDQSWTEAMVEIRHALKEAEQASPANHRPFGTSGMASADSASRAEATPEASGDS